MQSEQSTATSERRQRARIAAFSRWARVENRTLATAAARAAFDLKFEHEVDPDGRLSPDERARRAESARSAHYARLAYRSARARRKRTDSASE
jgi:hypothetical protein